MKSVRYYIGTNFDKNDKSIKDVEKLKSEAKRLCGLAFGGSTVFNGAGSWFDGAKMVNEQSITIEILTDETNEKLKAMAVKLRDLFSQSSVLMTVQNVNSEFI